MTVLEHYLWNEFTLRIMPLKHKRHWI